MVIRKITTTKQTYRIQQRKQVVDYDVLTRIHNRQYFETALEQQIIQAKALKDTFFMIVIDIDHFKDINNLYGYDVGNAMLKVFAERLQTLLSINDVYARWGGGEFAVMILGIKSVRDLRTLLNRLLQEFRVPYVLFEKKIQSHVSIGVSQFKGLNTTIHTMIRNTNLALQSAKLKGRNCYDCFDQKMSAKFYRFHLVEAALKKAIINKEITMVFQPVIELSTQRIAHIEALARWDSSELRETIEPSEFIYVAEQSDLILQLTELVLHITCQTMQTWKKEVNVLVPVAINISAWDIIQKNFIVMLNSIIKQYGLTTDLFHIELTETTLINNFYLIKDSIRHLRRQGFRIAIDDFGVGYSSLERLKNISVDYIKIDQSFILTMFTDVYSIQIVRGILDMAKQLGISAIAEGVETREVAQFLMRWHCRYAQGYFFSAPVRAEHVLPLVGHYNGSTSSQHEKLKTKMMRLCNMLMIHCQEMNMQFATLIGYSVLLLKRLPPSSDVYAIVESIHVSVEDTVKCLNVLMDNIYAVQQRLSLGANMTQKMTNTITAGVKKAQVCINRSIARLEFNFSPILSKKLKFEREQFYHFEDIFALIVHIKLLNEQLINID